MAPKKAQKMSLNEFLGDNTLGSWADEMDSLPTAPAARADGEAARPSDRRRGDDFLSSRSDRSGPPREDLPLPTEPPFTAFIGNLAFDLTETELEEFFNGLQTKSVKIIRDRDDKPKGFGYIEFVDLDGLKEALSKSGSSLAGRTIRVSVAEPPKERSGFGGGGFDDDSKFAGNWRREGPLPDLPSRDGSRRRLDGPGREPPPASISDNASDWRASARAPVRAPPATSLDADSGSFKRRSTFRENGQSSVADTEETWAIGSKFKPSAPSEGPGSRFGNVRGRGDMGPPRDAPSPPDDDNWRRPHAISRNSTSPSGSTPPTPQMGRRKLELLPRSGASATPSPLASPNPSASPSLSNSTISAARSNPFGAAKPVDVTAREKEVEERLSTQREQTKERVLHSMSRTSSRTAAQREHGASRTPSTVSNPASPVIESHKPSAASANVRPSFSFAHAAATKKDEAEEDEAAVSIQEMSQKIGEVQI